MSSKREHVHHGPVAEVVGFACRWLLLTAGAALILVIAWQSLLATVGVSQDIRVRFLQPDVLCRTNLPDGWYCAQPGVLIGQASEGKQPTVLAVRQARPVRMGQADSGRTFNFYWPGCDAGLTPARVVGVPYGPAAFQRQTTYVLGVPRGTPVALVDFRLMPDDPNEPNWTGLLDALQQRGPTALFVMGRPEQYQGALERRNRGGIARRLPLLYRLEEPPYVLRRTAGMLGRKNAADMIVVTGDPNLAERTAQAGLAAHLIAPAGTPMRQSPKVVAHSDLRSLRDSLLSNTR